MAQTGAKSKGLCSHDMHDLFLLLPASPLHILDCARFQYFHRGVGAHQYPIDPSTSLRGSACWIAHWMPLLIGGHKSLMMFRALDGRLRGVFSSINPGFRGPKTRDIPGDSYCGGAARWRG